MCREERVAFFESARELHLLSVDGSLSELQQGSSWRKTENVREVGIERQQNSATLNCKHPYAAIRLSRQTYLDDGNCIVPLFSQKSGMPMGEIFIK